MTDSYMDDFPNKLKSSDLAIWIKNINHPAFVNHIAFQLSM